MECAARNDSSAGHHWTHGPSGNDTACSSGEAEGHFSRKSVNSRVPANTFATQTVPSGFAGLDQQPLKESE